MCAEEYSREVCVLRFARSEGRSSVVRRVRTLCLRGWVGVERYAHAGVQSSSVCAEEYSREVRVLRFARSEGRSSVVCRLSRVGHERGTRRGGWYESVVRACVRRTCFACGGARVRTGYNCTVYE